MKKDFLIVLTFFIALQSCKTLEYTFDGAPITKESTKKIDKTIGYRIEETGKFEYLVYSHNNVIYDSEVERTFRYKNNYLINSLLLGAGIGSLLPIILNEKDYKLKGVPFGAGLGILVSLSYSANVKWGEFEQKIKFVKRKVDGPQIVKNEWFLYRESQINVECNNQNLYLTTNTVGKLNFNPLLFYYPILTEHQDFQLSFSKNNFKNFATATINSSWWMKTYGVINEDPVYIQGALSPPTRFPGHALLGAGSTVFQKEQDLLMLKINNNNAWLQPSSLNLFFYSSSLDLGEIPALKSIDYKLKDWAIIKLQKRLIESEINK